MNDSVHRWIGTPPELDSPVMIVSLRGWIDAAGAAESAAAAIKTESDTYPVVEFDDDTFVDYRARRPVLELRNGVFDVLEWERIQLAVGTDNTGKDFVILTGPEPDMRWHSFVSAVGDIADSLGVSKMTHFGAYPFATPHTRPARLAVTTPSKDVAASVPFARSSIDVPAGVASALELEMHRRGIPAMGIWVQVPHYLPQMDYPAASVALLEGLNEATGLVIDAPTLRTSVLATHNRLDELVSGNDEYENMIRQLEQIYEATEGDVSVADNEPSIEMRSGDEIAAELEAFLRDID